MTANISGATAPATSVPIATRSQLLLGLFLIATLNGFAGLALKAVERLGWAHTAASASARKGSA